MDNRLHPENRVSPPGNQKLLCCCLFITSGWCFSPWYYYDNKFNFPPHFLLRICPFILEMFCGPKNPKGVLLRVNRVILSLTVFTSSPFHLSLPASGPEVITVCLHTDSNEPTESYSESISDHSTFDFWTSLPPSMIPTRLLKTTGGRQDNPTTHGFAGLVIPTGMSHSPLYIHQ